MSALAHFNRRSIRPARKLPGDKPPASLKRDRLIESEVRENPGDHHFCGGATATLANPALSNARRTVPSAFASSTNRATQFFGPKRRERGASMTVRLGFCI